MICFVSDLIPCCFNAYTHRTEITWLDWTLVLVIRKRKSNQLECSFLWSDFDKERKRPKHGKDHLLWFFKCCKTYPTSPTAESKASLLDCSNEARIRRQAFHTSKQTSVNVRKLTNLRVKFGDFWLQVPFSNNKFTHNIREVWDEGHNFVLGLVRHLGGERYSSELKVFM